ncbi:hypothetical protein BDZ89DRAFT_1070539 [Hymenopellis radicata]|nr:hypothetical protein BDZ89DRAFT_1070539 [Hymenopellis radicata]
MRSPEAMPSAKRPKFHTGSDSDSETESSRVASNSRGRLDTHTPNRPDASVDTATPPIPYWSAKRHLTCGNPTPQPSWSAKLTPWRNSTLGKLKTANAALILCLNMDVDPPDVIKTQPCAALECWVDPRLLPASRALEAIGANLKSQYEGLSLKIQYKPILDPSQDDIRKCCQQLRRQAKDDAVLFHYNGHGVPKPTASGELWCFNRNYTQYIPVGLHEIQTWLGSPGVYIWDCSAAGHLLQNFNTIAERRDTDMNFQRGGYPVDATPFMHSIQLAACAANEQLPSCPELPADVFTSCLTSPIDMALRYFVINERLPDGVEPDMIMQLPGDLKDRRTPLGELNWIFIAITDTIAWTSFSRETFSRLYRCDLLVASLFRNFLLAERILKNYNCTPHTYPPLPATNTIRIHSPSVHDEHDVLPGRIGSDTSQSPPYVYVPNRFFADQLTAFEDFYLDEDTPKRGSFGFDDALVPRKPPDQLPIVLQVLLSQPHRLRALILLSQFLLQAAGQDLRPVLIFIWTRILAVDPSVQTDLYNNPQGYRYFTRILAMPMMAMCCFILSSLSRDFPNGQNACLDERVFEACLHKLDDGDFLLRQWAALCMAQLWDSSDKARADAISMQPSPTEKLIDLLCDASVEVRCAALFALQTLMGTSGAADPEKRGGGGTGTLLGLFDQDESMHLRVEVSLVTNATFQIKEDASPMCRKELLVLISCLVKEWRGYFVVCAWLYWEEDRRWRSGYDVDQEDLATEAIQEWEESLPGDNQQVAESKIILKSIFTIFLVLLDLSIDPYPEVAAHAQTIVDYVMALLLESPFSKLSCTTLKHAPELPNESNSPIEPPVARQRTHSTQSVNLPPSPNKLRRPAFSRADTIANVTNSVSNTLRRTSSFANALKSLAGGVTFPSADDGLSLFSSPSKPEFSEPLRPPSPNLNVVKYVSPYYRSAVPYTNGNGAQADQDIPQPIFFPAHVMEALMEEDMERLRARHRRHRRNGNSVPSPSRSTFSTDSTGSYLVGLGTGNNMKDVLPLKSSYFDWCTEYFTEPQMRQTEADEPGSVQYNHQVWRQRRNEQVDAEIHSQAEAAPYLPWDRSVATLQATGHPMTMAFHSYDKHLVVANENDVVTVWDWSSKKRLNQFCNGNHRGSSITSLHLINQDVGGIILTGSDDGIIRLFRNYDPALEQGPVQLVSAFRGLERIPMQRGSGLITDWKASNGTLLIGGDSRVIQTWDAQTELHGPEIETQSDSPVTAIAAGRNVFSDTFLAGFADGAVKMFDLRLDVEEPVVTTFPGHSAWVQNICPHPTYSHQFLSAGSQDGVVKLWDLRNNREALGTWNLSPSGLAAFDVHRNAEVFAGSSAISPTQWKEQKVKVQSMKKATVSSALVVSTGHVHPPRRSTHRMTSLVFHPTEMLYGVGEPDGTVRILGCNLGAEPDY